MTVAVSNPSTKFPRWSALTRYGASFWSHNGLIAFVAANVNNGSVADTAFHVDTSPVGSWLRWDAGANSRKAFRGLAIWCIVGSPGGAYFQFDIQFSDDGATWTTVIPAAGGHPFYAMWWVVWDPVGGHRYWRLYKVNGAVAGSYISEVQWID